MQHALELFEQAIPLLRPALSEDGAAVSSLSRTADQEAIGYLLGDLATFDDYKEFSIIAELDGDLVAAMLAYVLPCDPETLFVWLVGVSEGEADKGVASLMLAQVMRRDVCADVTRVQTVTTSNNECTWALFRRFARWQRSRMDIQPFIKQALTPYRRHENSNLVTIRLEDRSEFAA